MSNVALGRLRRWALIGLIAALGACLALGAALLLAPSRSEQLARARARWAARPFARYRLVTEHAGGLVACQQDAEIVNERVVKVFRNTCPRSAVTITNLFLDVEHFRLTIGGRCGPNGCGCDGPIDVDVDYDPALGYPRSYQVRSAPEARWQYLDYWRGVLAGSGCHEVGFVGPAVKIMSLAPVP